MKKITSSEQCRGQFPVYITFLTLTILFSSFKGFSQAPAIDVWYGDIQKFGHIGNPQQWINILGNVSDPDGIQTLTYRLNGGGEVPLSIGPDGRRLQNEGDFNIDIATSSLQEGANAVAITAIDVLNNATTKEITVKYTSGKTWPAEYTFDWDTVTHIQNVVQIVDGKWEKTEDGLRTVETGYDRVVAIGDMGWKNYEVTVPVTVHQTSPHMGPNSGPHYGLGILMLWQGHTDRPVSGWQPKSGYFPLGDIGWLNWPRTDDPTTLSFFNGGSTDFPIANGKTYIFKFQTFTEPGTGNTYRLKVWEAGTAEPSKWLLTNFDDTPEITEGSFMLIAHYVDATFGNPAVRQLSPDDIEQGVLNSPPVVNQPVQNREFLVNTLTGFAFDEATFTDPDGDSLRYAASLVNGDPLPAWLSFDAADRYFHGTPTIPDTLEIRIVAQDDSAATASTSFHLYVRQTPQQDFISDNFNASDLNDVWTFIDPSGDGAAVMNTETATLNLFAPGGTAHDPWTGSNGAVRIMQNAPNTDFGIEVKFESGISSKYQMQGILVEQDADNYLRFDFHSDGKKTRNLAAVIGTATSSIKTNLVIGEPGIVPLYLRVTRAGNTWKMAYSQDGEAWTTSTTFDHVLSVSRVGVFAGNMGSPVPEHTAVVDYFYNMASPLEDAEEHTPNRQPVVNQPILTQKTAVNASFNFIFDEATFTDLDGDSLRYTASLTDGTPLPDWLIFNGGNRHFHGTPTSTDTLEIKLTAEDDSAAMASTTFHLYIYGANEADFISDNFDSTHLKAVWTFIDPVGDGAAVTDAGAGTLHLSVSDQQLHDVWTGGNNAVRIMQNAPNTDFGIEVKFESGVSAKYQMQGILVEQDAKNYLRLEFHSDSSNTRIYGAGIVDNVGSTKFNLPIDEAGIAPLYLRVMRTGNTWEVAYSIDGEEWTTGGSFLHALSVARVGVFAGNTGTPVPQHTAVVDYFYNMAAPLEDTDEMVPNSPPAVNQQIPDQETLVNTSYSFMFDEATFTDTDGDSLRYTASLTGGDALPEWLTFNAAERLFLGTPTMPDTLEINLTAEDGSGATANTSFHLYIYMQEEEITPNRQPVVSQTIQDQQAFINTLYSFVFDEATFTDPDGDSLRYAASLADGGALPGWLTFDAAERHFHGTPTTLDSLQIRLTAEDDSAAIVSTIFYLYVDDTVQENPVTGVFDDEPSRKTVHVYPNPVTQNVFFIELPSDAGNISSLELINAQGTRRIIPMNNFRVDQGHNNKIEIDISNLHLPAGMYVLKIRSGSSDSEIIRLSVAY